MPRDFAQALTHPRELSIEQVAKQAMAVDIVVTK